jgi:hypothetical protein
LAYIGMPAACPSSATGFIPLSRNRPAQDWNMRKSALQATPLRLRDI